jgi:site-specific DNA recombinase
MDRRFAHRHRIVKHDFPFSGIGRCGHCGCAVVGELKKGRYIYHHCTGQKGNCGEPYVRQELLEQKFGDILDTMRFEPAIIEWAKKLSRQTNANEQQFHRDAVGRLQESTTASMLG